MAADNGVYVTHAAIAQLKSVPGKHFMEWVGFRKVVINKWKEAFRSNTYFGFYILTVWRVEPHYVPLATSSRFWCIRICCFVWWVVFVATFVTAALKHGFRNGESGNGNGNGIRNPWKKVPSDRFEKKKIINDNKINKEILKKTLINELSRGDCYTTRGVDSGEKTLDTTCGNECKFWLDCKARRKTSLTKTSSLRKK